MGNYQEHHFFLDPRDGLSAMYSGSFCALLHCSPIVKHGDVSRPYLALTSNWMLSAHSRSRFSPSWCALLSHGKPLRSSQAFPGTFAGYFLKSSFLIPTWRSTSSILLQCVVALDVERLDQGRYRSILSTRLISTKTLMALGTSDSWIPVSGCRTWTFGTRSQLNSLIPTRRSCIGHGDILQCCRTQEFEEWDSVMLLSRNGCHMLWWG